MTAVLADFALEFRPSHDFRIRTVMTTRVPAELLTDPGFESLIDELRHLKGVAVIGMAGVTMVIRVTTSPSQFCNVANRITQRMNERLPQRVRPRLGHLQRTRQNQPQTNAKSWRCTGRRPSLKSDSGLRNC